MKSLKLFKEEIINKNPYLFWHTKSPEKLSEEAFVETILTKGNFDHFVRLLYTIGFEKTADIFYKQISRKRTNYNKKTINYLTIFFEKHLKNA